MLKLYNMQQLTIHKQGNSFSINLPEELVEKLNIKEGDALFITETDDGITLSKYDDQAEKAMKIYHKGSEKYRNALRELAK